MRSRRRGQIQGFPLVELPAVSGREGEAFTLVELPAVSGRQRRAFTLVELLVAVGIIAIMIAILLPTLARARESANRVACLSNLRQLAAAVIAYAGENKSHLPDACPTNSTDSAYSPRATGLRPWTPLPAAAYGQGAYVMPSIGDALQRWTSTSPNIWNCRSAQADNRATTLRGDAFCGITMSDEFRPTYFYMGGKDYFVYINSAPSLAAEYHLRDWAVRSVAGLPLGQVHTLTRQDASQIVLLRDYYVTYHTRARSDIYDLEAGQKDDYFSNYAYLDGHADGKTYHDFPEYIGQMHAPIRQRWWGADFSTAFSQQYK